METTVFYNKKNHKDSKSTEIVLPLISGKFGYYSKLNGQNISEQKLLLHGFKRTTLDTEFINSVRNLENKRYKRIQKQVLHNKLTDRAKQVDICLDATPVKVELNTGENPFVSYVANLAESDMIEAYQGCGKGTAYLNDRNELIAFHYGYDRPYNYPNNSRAFKVELSATQICFFSEI